MKERLRSILGNVQQGDGQLKRRPVIILNEMPPFGAKLVPNPNKSPFLLDFPPELSKGLDNHLFADTIYIFAIEISSAGARILRIGLSMKTPFLALLLTIPPGLLSADRGDSHNSYEVAVYGSDAKLQVEAREYQQKVGLNPNAQLGVNENAPKKYVNWNLEILGTLPESGRSVPAEMFRLIYRGVLIGQIPGNLGYNFDRNSGFTVIPRPVVSKVVDVGGSVLIIEVIEEDSQVAAEWLIRLNPPRTYVATRNGDGKWQISQLALGRETLDQKDRPRHKTEKAAKAR